MAAGVRTHTTPNLARQLRRAENTLASPVRLLNYHRVAEQTAGSSDLSVSPDNFAGQMAVLAGHAEVTGLTDSLALRRNRVRRKGRHTFGVTFDDGYVDNLQVALPILERHGIPATLFVTTGTLGRRCFWWDRIAELTTTDSVGVERLLLATVEVGLAAEAEVDALTALPQSDRHIALRQLVVAHPFDRRHEVVDDLSDALGFAPADTCGRPMSIDELVEFSQHPLVTIGAHGHWHAKLTELTAPQLATDVGTCLERLQSTLGAAPTLFAYPHGAVDPGVVDQIRRVGLSWATGTESRPLSVLDSRWNLPRIATADIDGDEFARRRRLG